MTVWDGWALGTAPVAEAESAGYGACRATVDGMQLVLRVAKTTPTKIGQFVTLWKRPHPGAEIAPLDDGDAIDAVIIAVACGGQHGYFCFSRAVLLERGVMSRAGIGGKRALRVYTPWCTPASAQALRTQRWQLPWFVETGDRLRLSRLLASSF